MHVFVIFLMAYTTLASEEASLILSFVFAILGPLMQADTLNNMQSEVDGSPARRKLVTPTAVAKSLNLQERFNMFLLCVSGRCRRLNIWDGDLPASGNLKCWHCLAYTIVNRRFCIVYTQRTVEMIIASILQDEKLEWSLEEEYARGLNPEHNGSDWYDSVRIGKAWRDDCTRVSCKTPCTDHKPYVEESAFNLKVTLSVDWFRPFKGTYSSHYSIGTILMCVDNLPARFGTLDRKCRGIHLVSLLPGLAETPKKVVEQCLGLIIDEIHKLDERGALNKTASHPEGRTVRVRLNMVVADSPARAKMVGFSGNWHSDNICYYCSKHTDQFGMQEMWEDAPLESQAGPSSSQSMAAVRTSVFDRLPYFDRQLHSPPDPMHAVHLGMCKRFWHKLLIDACRDIGKRLGEAQRII
ncbi:uncharacterized protein SPSC_01762 [Sporisorium scitamineum]|uniref:Uncharacterized protein n=1 Tax=Sporisorium scitamineum TaxID=49012 RepID=A0A127ZAY2_9BASI|nr:uncharacterized protein SPSC_01762 [Sporisorium scitamineum]